MTRGGIECVAFESETKIRVGAVIYIVAAHFDETRESLPEIIRRLLSIEVENKVAQLPDHSQ